MVLYWGEEGKAEVRNQRMGTDHMVTIILDSPKDLSRANLPTMSCLCEHVVLWDRLGVYM